MPDVQEVFRMATQKVRPEPGFIDRQHENQRRQSRRRKAGALTLVAAIAVVAVVWIVGIRGGENTTTPADEPGTVAPGGVSGPFFLDLRTGDKTPLPKAIVPEGVGAGVSVFYTASPDGTRIAYNTCHPGGCSKADDMVVAAIDGSDARSVRLPEGLNGYAPHWSPDGTKIVYQLRNGASLDLGNLFVQDLSSGQTTQLTDLKRSTAGWWFMSPRFSPDGQSVIFHLARDSSATTKFDVWSVPVTGGEPALVLRNALFPMVLPAGEGGRDDRIAFVKPSGFDLSGDRISIADAEGSRRTLVEANVAIGFPTMSPDGSGIAYQDGGSIYVVDVSTGESSKVADGYYDNVSWLDDDTLIVT
jgi:dipeptidyl aminopeptidase/acylaminoacyl peptidase